MPLNNTVGSLSESGTIAIIGGGPAGSATALSLLQSGRYDVRLFNATQYSKIKIGETIPPAVTPVLERLGVSHILSEKEHLPCSGSVSLWGSDTPGHNDFWLDPVGKGFHLDRDRFDQQLCRAAKSQGAQCFEGWRLRSVTRQAPGFELQFRLQNGEAHRLNVDFVVDASGQSASFARRLGVARNVLDEVISLCAIFPLPKNLEMSDRTFAEATGSGWWYAARLPAERIVVSFTSDAGVIKEQALMDPKKWNEQLQKSRGLKDWLPAALLQQLPELQVKAAPSSILSCVAGKGWLAVGDAASSYDPLTSAGITKALMQGELAGRTIARTLQGKDWQGKDWQEKYNQAMSEYQNRVFEEFNQYTSLRNRLYMAESRYHLQPFWQRRHLLSQ